MQAGAPDSNLQLGIPEIQSAFAMKVRAGVLDRKVAGMQPSRFLLILFGEVQRDRKLQGIERAQTIPEAMPSDEALDGCVILCHAIHLDVSRRKN